MSQPAKLVLWAALALSGCAPSAIFEFELELPAATEDVRYALITARAEGASVPLAAPLELAPRCNRASPPPACGVRTLDPDCSAVVSIVSDEAPASLEIEVRLCSAADCADAGSVHRIEVERPFYPGRHTQGRVCLDEAPADVREHALGRCDVRCREGTAGQSCRLDGTHFCE